jgi:DNA-binding transcriptional MerR regulator
VSGNAMLRIGDFSRLTRVTIKTLRHYDEVGLLKPAAIDRFTGYRYYTLDQLPRLNRILVLKDLGLSLEQIAPLLDGDADELRGMLRIKRAELQQHIEDEQARLARIDMRLRQLEGNMPDYEVMIKSTEPQQVLSVRRIVLTTNEIHALLDEVRTALHQHRIKASGPWIAMYHHAGFRDHDLDLEVAVPVESVPSDRIALSDGWEMSIRVIPALAMVVSVLLQGGYDQLGSAYQALDTYLHEHGHYYLGPAREIYLRGPGDTDNPAEYLTEVQYPIGKYTGETPGDGIPDDWNAGEHALPFSRRARTALEFARQEAAVLHQPEVVPVHMLLGLLRDGDSFAAQVLSNFGITIEHIRTLAPRDQSQSPQPSISDSAQHVIAYAHEEAVQLGHNYTGTEHVLLGLLRQQDALVIHALRATPQQVRAAVLQTFQR